MEIKKNERFNPFNGLSTIDAIDAKLSEILSLSGTFFQESSDPKVVKKLAEEAIQKILKN